MEDSAAYRFTHRETGKNESSQRSAWRCSWCGRIEGDDDGHGYTDGICSECLWKYYPDRAARVIAAVERAGTDVHLLPDPPSDVSGHNDHTADEADVCNLTRQGSDGRNTPPRSRSGKGVAGPRRP